ncbi:hypothetical protein hrd7_11940 [Leptolinea sp. HRD-7]|nr:hypothetical protein hrd7_11940 [Leptolinea sp. HRD-7]
MNLSNNVTEDDFAEISKLSWECISPVIMTVRGKNPDIKNDAYRTLNEGQKAVFSFHVYYDHAKKDPESFVYWSRLYLQMNFFGEIKKGALYFANQDYANLLAEIEGCLTGTNNSDPQQLYEQLKSIGEEHIIRMGKAIKANRPYFFTG